MVYCAGNEQTFTFLQNILTEVMDVFDTPYIHIGGEELRKGAWVDCAKCQGRIKELGMTETSQLHQWMMARMSQFVVEHNRRPVGYSDNYMNQGIPANQIVQGWHPGWVEFAARRGFEALNSVHKVYYLNYPASEKDRIAYNHPEWMLTNTIQKIYAADPVPDGLTREQQDRVIGAESPLWTEQVPQERVDEKVFPRLIALAEVLWTPKKHLDFDNFSSRLDSHYHRLDRLGVKYMRLTEDTRDSDK
jgi:hexosaminidase